MLNFLKLRTRKAAAGGRGRRDPLEIRDLLEHPQLRAAMGLEPLPGTFAPPHPSSIVGRSRRDLPAATAPSPVPLTRSAA